MNVTSDTIEQLLRQIACGQLDADAAARTVLGIDSGEPASQATIGGLIRDFGPPPEEIERDWQRQFEAFSADWRQSRREPVPPFEPDDWFVTADNRISPRWLAAEPGAPPDPVPTLRPEEKPLPSLAVPELARASESSPRMKKASPQFGGRRRPLVLATAIALIGCSYLTVQHLMPTPSSQPSSSNSSPNPQAKRSPKSSPSTVSAHPATASERPGGDFPASVAAASPGFAAAGGEQELQLLEAATPPQADVSQSRQLPVLDPIDDLARLLDPSPAQPATLPAQPEPARETVDESTLPPDQHRVAVPASGQEAITLPPFSAAGEPAESLLLTGLPVGQLAWEFPAAPGAMPPIELRSDSDQSWALVGREDQRELAALRSTPEGLWFTWAEDASRHSNADQVAAGRLRLTASDQSRFDLLLRPSLRCEPMSLDLSQPDTRFSWQLDGPPVFASPLWSLEFDESEAAELEWLETPDPSQVRRGQARVRWKLPEDDFPLIGCHLESRVTSRWTLRLRYAVQLSETSPWQPFSTRQLTQALEKMTALLNQSLLQQSELARQYSLATPTVRRQLKPAKETLDQQVLGLQDTMTRLRKLNDLANALAGIRFKIGLTTAWPDRRQVVFEMVDPPRMADHDDPAP
jgi:hypothetical protein